MDIRDLSPLLLKHIYFVLVPEVFITSDPSTMGRFDHIPELTGASIFQAWKTQIVLALGHKGVYNHVSDGMDLSRPFLCQSYLSGGQGVRAQSSGKTKGLRSEVALPEG